MPHSKPIVLIEDDAEDKEILEQVLSELDNNYKLVWLQTAEKAFEYLCTTHEKIFLIFSDINLPGTSGLDLKRQIDGDKDLREKSIPFVFYSTAVTEKAVKEAYGEMTVQGFFKKGNSMPEIKKQIQIIVDYWATCRHPNF